MSVFKKKKKLLVYKIANIKTNQQALLIVMLCVSVVVKMSSKEFKPRAKTQSHTRTRYNRRT